jgi:hypothetical protein
VGRVSLSSTFEKSAPAENCVHCHRIRCSVPLCAPLLGAGHQSASRAIFVLQSAKIGSKMANFKKIANGCCKWLI